MYTDENFNQPNTTATKNPIFLLSEEEEKYVFDNLSFEQFCESLQSISLKIVYDSTSQQIIIYQTKTFTDKLNFYLDIT